MSSSKQLLQQTSNHNHLLNNGDALQFLVMPMHNERHIQQANHFLQPNKNLHSN